MLKKKISSILTAVIRNCPECGTQVTLNAAAAETKCAKCGTIVDKKKESDDESKE